MLGGTISDILYIPIKDPEIGRTIDFVCSHYPLEDFPAEAINLHGHIHTEGNQIIRNPNKYDVGVDNNNMTPISYKGIKVLLTKHKLNPHSRPYNN
jgi:calcineurin-like phosphoesterase family protein